MADTNDPATTKAESLLKRVLERLGEAVDRKVGDPEKVGLRSAEMANLETLLERSIDAGVVDGASRTIKVAPNEFTVSLTYETASSLGKTYLKALEEELQSCALEFINNRRYSIVGGVRVKVTSDVLAKSPSVKASISATESAAGRMPFPAPAQAPRLAIELKGDHGASYRLEIAASSTPANMGRVAGCALSIEDPSVSRLHASIALTTDGKVVVSDLGSANGTSVNGEIVNTGEAREVTAGDVITLGDVELTVADIARVE